MADIPDMKDVARDLQAQKDEGLLIGTMLDPFAALCVIGQLQLAARHPENSGPALEEGVKFAAQLAESLPESAQALVELGWNPENDA